LGISAAIAISDILKVNSSLDTLGLNDNQISDRGANAIALGLGLNTNLTSLDMRQNVQIISYGRKSLMQILLKNDIIKTFGRIPVLLLKNRNVNKQKLDLSRSNIGDTEVMIMAALLENNSIFTKCNLEENEIGHPGTEAIGKALKANTILTSLNLKSNKIGDNGAQAIGESLRYSA